MNDARALVRELLAGVEELEGRELGSDAWSLRSGRVPGILRIEADDADPLGGRLIVRFQIGRPPRAGAAALHRRLLDLNHGLGGLVAFSVDEEGAPWVSAARPLAGLDAEGLAAAVAVVAGTAAEYALDRSP